MSLKYLPIRKIAKMFEKLTLEFRQPITGKLLYFVEYFDKQLQLLVLNYYTKYISEDPN